ncbi:hypothetical protein Sm713_73950 [Streptomyces sp. TS71-3]|nr:hypothetical protein Sm713_73950 [Streptomyces sp. TS71-3]
MSSPASRGSHAPEAVGEGTSRAPGEVVEEGSVFAGEYHGRAWEEPENAERTRVIRRGPARHAYDGSCPCH